LCITILSNVDTSNVLVFLLSGKEMRFQVPRKTFRLDCQIMLQSGSKFQTVGPAT